MKKLRAPITAACLAVSALLTGTATADADGRYKTVKTARNGLQTVYGLVTPLDQEGRHFYLRKEDGLIEVKLSKDATGT